jgi:hypothetical protein
MVVAGEESRLEGNGVTFYRDWVVSATGSVLPFLRWLSQIIVGLCVAGLYSAHAKKSPHPLRPTHHTARAKALPPTKLLTNFMVLK